jgi:hypothetical protein
MESDMIWIALHPQAHPDMLGYIPSFLSEEDPRKASEQIDTNYQHGGGWTPFTGFTLLPDGAIKYPGDPALPPLFRTKLRDECITFFDCSWLMITQPDGSWEISRLD